MDAREIAGKIEAAVAARGCFLVDVKVSADNDVTLAIESEEGTVVMEDCIAIDKAFHEIWDQDIEDYALTVTSAGLDQPFKVLRQYRKFIGKEVEVVLNKGGKIKGILSEADEQKIVLAVSVSVKPEGSKKKVRMETLAEYPFGEFKSCKPVIKFK